MPFAYTCVAGVKFVPITCTCVVHDPDESGISCVSVGAGGAVTTAESVYGGCTSFRPSFACRCGRHMLCADTSTPFATETMNLPHGLLSVTSLNGGCAVLPTKGGIAACPVLVPRAALTQGI